MDEIQIIRFGSVLFVAWGFFRYRHWLKEWSKDWWEQMKIAWKGGRK